ncbi:MAG: RluA family pseudouridine synthase [Flavobacteriaceae bacterium]
MSFTSLESRILFEDNHIIMVNKISGELVQGDQTKDIPLVEKVKSYLKKKYNKPGAVFLGVVHRIDRPTSGIILFAKTSKALTRLNEQFKNRLPNKSYWAIVSKNFPDQNGKLIHWMTRNTQQNKSKAHSKPVPNAKEARLHYVKLIELDRYSILEIKLETGRHHQIRAQLSEFGFPIVGDLKYGAARSNKDGSICLHAKKLQIDHPVTQKTITISAELPESGIWKVVPFDLVN